MSELLEFIEEKCQEFILARQSTDKNRANNQKRKIVGQVCSSLPRASLLEEFTWFEEALKSDSKKWFVLEVFKNTSRLPKNLLVPLIQAAMNEPDPSLQGYFLKPCVCTYGEEGVANILRGYINLGSDIEKKAARSLLYWVPRFRKPSVK